MREVGKATREPAEKRVESDFAESEAAL